MALRAILLSRYYFICFGLLISSLNKIDKIDKGVWQAEYYTVIQHDGRLRTQRKCRNHELQACVFCISTFLHFSSKEVMWFSMFNKTWVFDQSGSFFSLSSLGPYRKYSGTLLFNYVLCNISFTCRYTNNSGLLELCADAKSDNLALSTLKRKTHNGA